MLLIFDHINPALILATASFVVVCALVWGLAVLRQHHRRLQARINRLEGELHHLSDTGIGMGRKLLSMEKRLKASERRHAERQAVEEHELGYNEAMRLLAAGADIEELMQSCRLSRAEAELMSALYLGQPSRHR